MFGFNISVLFHIYRLSPALGFSGVGCVLFDIFFFFFSPPHAKVEFF